MKRRTFLTATASLLAGGGVAQAAGAAPPRLAAIDWAMAETAMMLGLVPVAIAELHALRQIEPLPFPPEIVDIGLRGSPNLEALSLAAPDLILSSSYYIGYQARLEQIAPVFSREIFVRGEPPLPRVTALLDEVAARAGQPQTAPPAHDAFQRAVAQMQARLRHRAGLAVILIELGDPRHIRVFGTDSLFGGMIGLLGLKNGWDEGTQFSFAAPVPMERLIDFPDATIVITGDVPLQVQHGLHRSVLWNALAPVKEGRVIRLADMNGFGGLPSALRFARDLTDALERQR